MSPIVVFALLGVGAWALSKKSTPGASSAASEAPADANGLLATVLAPSTIDLKFLLQAYNVFMAAAENQANPAPTQTTNAAGPAQGNIKAAQRLVQYALATFLKAAMLTKGAQPDPNEILMFAYATIAGGAGLIGYGDIGVDRQAAVVAALAPTFNDAAALGTYIGAFAQAYNATKPGLERKRLLAFILALKAKQIALVNSPKFPNANQFDAPVYFAVANIPAANLPAVTVPNSILAY